MNTNRLKVSTIILLFLSQVMLLGMLPVVDHSNQVSYLQESPDEIQRQVITEIPNPLALGVTNKKYNKMVNEMLHDIGMNNLSKIYREKNPRLLLTHYVPIIAYETTHCELISQQCDLWIINPFCLEFNMPDELDDTSEIHLLMDAIAEGIFGKLNKIGETRINVLLDRMKIEAKNKMVSHRLQRSLFKMQRNVLCGSDIDIKKALNDPNCFYHVDLDLLKLIMSNPNKNNNAFELVMEELMKRDYFSSLWNLGFYGLLYVADKNNHDIIFKLLAPHIGRYNRFDRADGSHKTILDIMNESGYIFKQENIDIIAQNCGCTSMTAKKINPLGGCVIL